MSNSDSPGTEDMARAPTGPEFDVADRLRKALRESGTGVAQMAAHLEMSRRALSKWLNGEIRPDKRTLLAWADRTGVTYEWLAGLPDAEKTAVA